MGLRKKIAVSGKYKGTECEDGAVYYESVWWPRLQKPIKPPESLCLCGFLRVSLYIVYYLKFSILSIINNLFYNLSQSIALYLKVHIRI